MQLTSGENQKSDAAVFDRVARHMLTQNKRSYDIAKAICMYRGPAGLKCAIGCLIPDEEYFETFEKLPVEALKNVSSLVGMDMNLLHVLQQIHDTEHVHFWRESLLQLAVIRDIEVAPDLNQMLFSRCSSTT